MYYTLFYGVASGNRCLALNALPALIVSNNTKAKNERLRSHDKSDILMGESTRRKR